jgi:hypothetical protein
MQLAYYSLNLRLSNPTLGGTAAVLLFSVLDGGGEANPLSVGFGSRG